MSPAPPGEVALARTCEWGARRRAAPWERHPGLRKKESAAIRVTPPKAHDFGRGGEPSDRYGHGCYWDQHVETVPGEPTSPEGPDSQSGYERERSRRGVGPALQGRTKPPASGGRKTGSPDCKGNATRGVRGKTRNPRQTSRHEREPTPGKRRRPEELYGRVFATSDRWSNSERKPVSAEKPHPTSRGGQPRGRPC
jgi:hypothetical protein